MHDDSQKGLVEADFLFGAASCRTTQDMIAFASRLVIEKVRLSSPRIYTPGNTYFKPRPKATSVRSGRYTFFWERLALGIAEWQEDGVLRSRQLWLRVDICATTRRVYKNEHAGGDYESLYITHET